MYSKSKKAFEHNVGAEMEAGKPQDQSLAISYSVKRKKKAKGGIIKNEQASSEHRPMPQEQDKDSKIVAQNDHKRLNGQDNWIDNPTVAQAKRPSKVKLSQPKMVESNVIRAKLRDQESDLEQSVKPASPKEQPSKSYDEERPNRQGPKPNRHYAKGGNVAEMGPTNIERPDKGYGAIISKAKGGMINDKVSFKDSEQDELEHPAHLEDDNDQMKPSEEEIMSNHMDMLAEGGRVGEDSMDWDEEEIDHAASIAASIMAKRKQASMSAESDSDIDHEMHLADGGMVDIEENGQEEPNHYYRQNQEALKENYDHMDGTDQPMDSNEHSDQEELDSENEHDSDIVSAIRRKMKQSPITR